MCAEAATIQTTVLQLKSMRETVPERPRGGVWTRSQRGSGSGSPASRSDGAHADASAAGNGVADLLGVDVDFGYTAVHGGSGGDGDASAGSDDGTGGGVAAACDDGEHAASTPGRLVNLARHLEELGTTSPDDDGSSDGDWAAGDVECDEDDDGDDFASDQEWDSADEGGQWSEGDSGLEELAADDGEGAVFPQEKQACVAAYLRRLVHRARVGAHVRRLWRNAPWSPCCTCEPAGSHGQLSTRHACLRTAGQAASMRQSVRPHIQQVTATCF